MICPYCHHEHAGADLAFICVGCTCPRRLNLEACTHHDYRLERFKGALDTVGPTTRWTCSKCGQAVPDPEDRVFCTCSIEPGTASVPDPRLAWRHMASCPHASAFQQPAEQGPDLRRALAIALRDRDTMAETLTIAQARVTAMHNEILLLKARLARYGA